MLHRSYFLLLSFTLFFVFGCSLVAAQSGSRSIFNDPDADRNRPESSPGDARKHPLGSPEQEMLARTAIKHLETERQENLDRAYENAQLGADLLEAYLRRKSLDTSDLKKLDRIEKITKRIRSAAGANDSKDPLPPDAPQQLGAALTRLAAITTELHKDVERTPRQVISATLVERVNGLLDLVRHIRTLHSGN